MADVGLVQQYKHADGNALVPASSRAWRAAFCTQLEELGNSVAVFARKRAAWLNRKRKRSDEYLWRELLQDSLADTWTGAVTWDPSKAPLDLHLKRVIRSRAAMATKHLTRFPQVTTYGAKLGLEREMSESMAIHRASERAVDLSSYIRDVLGHLYRLARGDDAVTKILNCFGDGVVDRVDVMEATGLARSTYHDARRRLLALVGRLPRDLRDDVIRAMA